MLSMSTWEQASLSGRPKLSARGEGRPPPRAEVREQVLDVAQELVNLHGLAVGLGHLSFEEVIARADVSRTTAYRIWPRKERFLEDLLRRLAGTSSPCYGGAIDDQAAVIAQEVITSRLGELGTPEGRRAVLVEVCRTAGEFYFTTITKSPSWLTHVALIATMRSLGDAELTAELGDRMQQVEADAVANAAGLYESIATILGYRVRQVPGGYTTMTHVGTAELHGMLLLADIRSAISTGLGVCDPFDTGQEAEWSLPALGYTNTLLGLLEPDPKYNLQAVRTTVTPPDEETTT
jgi:AcrR family transcriptional regulator